MTTNPFDWRGSIKPDQMGRQISWELSTLGGMHGMLYHAIVNDEAMASSGWSGTPQGMTFQEAEKILCEMLQLKPFLLIGRQEEKEFGARYYQNDKTLLSIESPGGSEELHLGIRTLSEEHFVTVRDFANKNLKKHDRKGGVVFALMRENGALQLKRLGKAEVPIERDNYTDDALAGYDYVAKDLASTEPSGRLSIFTGPPGSGKTHLIRSLLGIETCTFMLIQAAYTELIAGPDFLPILYSAHDQTKAPLVIVLEDGDNAIARREGDNASAVSSLLNVSDGIIGSLLDIRVVVTSNVTKMDIDKAVLRPGRLSRQVDVGLLPLDKAQALIAKLTGGKGAIPPTYETRNGLTLADVYAAARGAGWTPPKREPGIGFQHERAVAAPAAMGSTFSSWATQQRG